MVIWLGLKDLVGAGGLPTGAIVQMFSSKKIINQGHGCPRRTIAQGRLLSNVIVDQGDICPKRLLSKYNCPR